MQKSGASFKTKPRSGSLLFLFLSVSSGGLIVAGRRAFLWSHLGTHDYGYLRYINLVPRHGTSEIRVLLKRLPRIITGAIQVRHKSGHNEKRRTSAVFMAWTAAAAIFS